MHGGPRRLRPTALQSDANVHVVVWIIVLEPTALRKHLWCQDRLAISFGYSQGKLTNSFDAQSYLNNYADLRNAFGTNEELATKHYVEYGFNEGNRLLATWMFIAVGQLIFLITWLVSIIRFGTLRSLRFETAVILEARSNLLWVLMRGSYRF